MSLFRLPVALVQYMSCARGVGWLLVTHLIGRRENQLLVTGGITKDGALLA